MTELEQANLALIRKLEARDRRIRRLVEWHTAALAHYAALDSYDVVERAAALEWWRNQMSPERIVQSDDAPTPSPPSTL